MIPSPRMSFPFPAALAFALGLGACGVGDEEFLAELDSGQHPLGSLQARIDLGNELQPPFVADEAVALISPDDDGGELVLHATDRDGRRSLSLVISLAQTEIPGLVDLTRHLVVYTEVDATGRPQLVLDDVPAGTLELSGDLVPGGEVVGTFQFDVPEAEEEGTPLVGRFEGSFAALLLADHR